MHQMDKMADAYISLAAAPAPDKGSNMPFPSSLRRSTKLFDKVPQQDHALHCCEALHCRLHSLHLYPYCRRSTLLCLLYMRPMRCWRPQYMVIIVAIMVGHSCGGYRASM